MTPVNAITISVLIPVLNEEDHLAEAAEAMLAQQFDGNAEFLFIDGGSTDKSRAILARLAEEDHRVRVLDNPHRRTPHALNIGLRAARGEFIARMDAHTIYPPRYLDIGISRLRHGDVEWVSGPQLAVGANAGSKRVALALRTPLGTGGARFRREVAAEFDVDTGFTGVWHRSVLEAHNGWDEEWINDQDVELAARIRRAGGRIVCVPEMAARYIPRASIPALARQYRKYGTYRVKSARRYPESLRRSQVLPPALTITTFVAIAFPGRIGWVARVGVAAYLVVVGAGAIHAATDGAGGDAAALPAVWATMHLSYGVGFLFGCVRYGPPIAAVGGLAVR